MTASVHERTAIRPEAAIVWIDRAHAHTIVVESGGRLLVESLTLPNEREDTAETVALAHVVEAIGDAPRVLLLGDNTMRTALEREYVALRQRPDRLVEMD